MDGQVVERVHTREEEGGAPDLNCNSKVPISQEEDLLRQIMTILKRNKNEVFLVHILTRARNLEKIKNKY